MCVRVCAGMEGRGKLREPKGTPLLILILFVRERMFAHNNLGDVIRIEILSILPCAAHCRPREKCNKLLE